MEASQRGETTVPPPPGKHEGKSTTTKGKVSKGMTTPPPNDKGTASMTTKTATNTRASPSPPQCNITTVKTATSKGTTISTITTKRVERKTQCERRKQKGERTTPKRSGMGTTASKEQEQKKENERQA